MDISKLYEIQKKTDARIIKEKNLEGQDLLPNTVLALQVEIAELANEWRGFKHWSSDREPRQGMLMEYADALHMFLSLANLLGLPEDDLYTHEDDLEGETCALFLELNHVVGKVAGNYFLAEKNLTDASIQAHFRMGFYLFANLGLQRLGLEWDGVCKAFIEKDVVNHQRQDNGY